MPTDLGDMLRATKVAADHARRAREAGAEGSYTAEEWLELCARYGNHCLACGADGAVVLLVPDHIRSLRSGGTNCISNIQPLCKPCNSRKGKKVIDYREEPSRPRKRGRSPLPSSKWKAPVGTVQIHIEPTADIKRRFHKKAIDEGLTMTEVIERLMDAWARGEIELPPELPAPS